MMRNIKKKQKLVLQMHLYRVPKLFLSVYNMAAYVRYLCCHADIYDARLLY